MSWFRSPQFARPIYFLSIGFLTLGLVAPGYLVQPVGQPGGFRFESAGGGALFDGGEIGGPLNFSEAFDSQYKEVIERLDAYHAQKTAQESVSKSPGKGINAVPNPTLAGLYTFYPQAGNLRTGTSGGDLWINNYVDLDSSNPPDPEDRNNPDYILDWNGRDYTYNGHCGIDSDPRSFGEMDIGVPVFAVLDGQVVESHDGEWDRSTTFTSKPANYVVLDHGGGHYTLYWHFKNGSVTAAGMSAGVQVKAGQQIGLTGSSGISTGPHLHFESRYGGSQWWGGSHFEPWQGVQSPGQSAWENQPAFCGTPYSRDCGYTGTNLSGYPVPEPFPRTGSFTAGNRTIYFWYMGTNLPAGSTYRINLVRNGTVVYAPASQSFNFSGRSYWFYYSLTGNFDTATWRYDLYINHGGQGEQLVSAAPFTVGTVSNHAPNNITVAFDPSTPDPDKPVICRVQSDLLLDDPDYNIVYYDYLWRVNGVSVRTVTSAGMSDVLRHDLYGPGDTVSCTVTPRDGTVNGTNASTQYTFPDAVTPMEITATRDGNSIVFSEAQGLMVSEAIHLDVAATNGGAPPVSLSVSSGPSGYSFAAVAGDGDFDWTPTTLQVGDFPVIFRAQNASAEVAYATAVLRVSRPERRIIAQPGDHFISIGFDATNPPRVWSQIFEPFVGGPRIALGRLITEYLYLQPIYPQLDRFFTLDADDDGDNDLITVLVTGGAVNPKSWILVHDLMTGQKVRPALRVLYESVFQNPEWNDYLVADVDGNDISEVAAIGVAAGVEPKRYYVQSYDVWNRIRVGAMQLFTDLGFNFPDPTLNDYEAGDIDADGVDEILGVGVTDHSPARTYVEQWNAVAPYQHANFRVLSDAEFALPCYNHFLCGNVDADAREEFVAIGVTDTSPRTTCVQVWNAVTGGQKYADLLVLNNTSYGHPEADRFLLADGNGDGKQELYAIGFTNQISGQIWVEIWDLQAQTRSNVFRILEAPDLCDPTFSEFFAMDADSDGKDELFAIGFAEFNSSRWVQVWDLDPVRKARSFRILRNSAFVNPIYDSWTGG